jgi:hypothetical protein
LALEVERTIDPNVGKAISAVWEETPADYRYESIQQQKFFAAACTGAGLIALVWLIKVWRTRVIVDDDSLTYGRRTIPWDAMIDLDSSVYHAKGWLTLIYQAGKTERRIKLDSYKIEAYDDVIDAICQTKGFANPIPIDEVGDGLEDDEAHRPDTLEDEPPAHRPDDSSSHS